MDDKQNKAPWYKRTFLWGQTNLTEDDPEKCDLDFWIDYWKKTGVEGVIINCGGIVSYYKSRFTAQYKAKYLGDKDYFGLWKDAARQAGLAVVARMDINATTETLYSSNPEWYCRDKEGNPYLSQGRYVACVNGGYYQEFLPQVFQEIIENYHPDGFADNSWAGMKRTDICYCENCRKKFREEYRMELPEKEDWEDPVYRKWVRWNYQLRIRNWHFFNKVTRKVGGEDCRWFGMLTADPFDTGERFYDIKALVKDSDFVFSDQQSRDPIDGFEQNSVNGNLLRLASSENILVAESMAHYYKGLRTFRLSAAPRQEVRNWMLTGISGGIMPWYHFVGGGTQDRRKFRISDDLFRWFKKQEPYLHDRVNCACVGLVWNQESAVYYGRGHGKEVCGYPFAGFARSLSKAGIPFVPVHADDIEKYGNRLETIILPNVAVLSREQEEQVIRFLQSGKGLVMTGMTGRMDEEGEERAQEECLLWKFLGLRKSGSVTGVCGDSKDDWMNHETHNYLKGNDTFNPLLEGLEDTSILPFGGSVVETASSGPLEAIFHLIPAFPIYPPEFSWIREEREDLGTIFAGELENGARVVYMPADVDRCYARFYLPDMGKLLENAVRYTAKNRFPVSAEGKGHIQCDAYVQGKKLILHLVNLCGCDGPVGSVTDNLPTGPVIIKITSYPMEEEAVSLISGKKLPIYQEGEWKCIRLEQLEEQEMILASMK